VGEEATYWEDRHARTSGLDGVGYLGIGAYNAWMYRVRGRVFDRLLRPPAEAVRGARVLDLGVGTGFYAERWRAAGAAEVVGLDVSELACQRLRDRTSFDIRCLDLATASDAAVAELGQFDAASAMDVLFHILDDDAYRRVLERLARLLRPGGRLILTENFLASGTREATPWQVSRSADELEAWFRGAGFTVDVRRPAFVLMNRPLKSGHPLLRLHWSAVTRLAGRARWAGHALGAATYLGERALTRVATRAPSTEIAVLKRS
jgi:SAM-dependent methyltransferase